MTKMSLFFLRFYLFIFRERKGGRKKGRETSMCGCLLSAPYLETGLQPRHVLWLGIKPVIHRVTSKHSIHWAMPARAKHSINFIIFCHHKKLLYFLSIPKLLSVLKSVKKWVHLVLTTALIGHFTWEYFKVWLKAFSQGTLGCTTPKLVVQHLTYSRQWT